MSTQVSLRGMFSLIRVDTLRNVHNVGFSRGSAHMNSHQYNENKIKTDLNIYLHNLHVDNCSSRSIHSS